MKIKLFLVCVIASFLVLEVTTHSVSTGSLKQIHFDVIGNKSEAARKTAETDKDDLINSPNHNYKLKQVKISAMPESNRGSSPKSTDHQNTICPVKIIGSILSVLLFIFATLLIVNIESILLNQNRYIKVLTENSVDINDPEYYLNSSQTTSIIDSSDEGNKTSLNHNNQKAFHEQYEGKLFIISGILSFKAPTQLGGLESLPLKHKDNILILKVHVERYCVKSKQWAEVKDVENCETSIFSFKKKRSKVACSEYFFANDVSIGHDFSFDFKKKLSYLVESVQPKASKKHNFCKKNNQYAFYPDSNSDETLSVITQYLLDRFKGQGNPEVNIKNGHVYFNIGQESKRHDNIFCEEEKESMIENASKDKETGYKVLYRMRILYYFSESNIYLTYVGKRTKATENSKAVIGEFDTEVEKQESFSLLQFFRKNNSMVTYKYDSLFLGRLTREDLVEEFESGTLMPKAFLRVLCMLLLYAGISGFLFSYYHMLDDGQILKLLVSGADSSSLIGVSVFVLLYYLMFYIVVWRSVSKAYPILLIVLSIVLCVLGLAAI